MLVSRVEWSREQETGNRGETYSAWIRRNRTDWSQTIISVDKYPA
jgi:hypothetical protein